jgi:two-component system, NtrC family, sensor histidine kinase HydH
LRTIVSRGDRIMEVKATERLRLEEKLNQSERLAHLGTMVATVSHEIKSPLGIVRSTAELLEKRIKTVAPGNEQLARIIVDETTRLNNIVMEFLDFARPQQPKFEKIDINVVVRKALQFIEPNARERNVEVQVELASGLASVYLDAEMFYRALLNILVNGLQAIGAQGVLQVRTASGESPGSVTVTICDSGKGMSAEKMEQIFQPFFSDKNRGTGLGLAITRNIIEQHHGTIKVESKEGDGSTFVITLV